MSEKTAIAVHACGFENKDEICLIAKSRLLTARGLAREYKAKDLIISGGVSYQSNSELLAHLMGQWIINNTFVNLNIHYAIDCFDSSTDVQNILSIAQEQQFANLVATSSLWHLLALKPLYRYWAKKLNYQGKINFAPTDEAITRTYPVGVSKKTVFFYSFYGLLIETTILFGLFKPLDKLLKHTFSKRKNGYPVTGCS